MAKREPLYYVLREGLVRGQGRYFAGFSAYGRPFFSADRSDAHPVLTKREAAVAIGRLAAWSYPMRVVAIVSKR
jgi:hypothetical protein